MTSDAMRQHDALAQALNALLTKHDPDVAPASGAVLAMRSPTGDYTATVGARQTLTDTGMLPDPLPMTLDTALDLGSVTKVVATTTALMALLDRGEVHIADPVRRYLPAAPVEASIRELLLHRAGLWEWWPLYVEATSRAEAMATICRMPARYPPGERHYSDLGFLLLGAVVERVTALSLDAAVDELVLTPFGLTGTRFARPVGNGPVIATSRGDRIERRMIDTGEPYPVDARSADFPRWRDRVLVGEVNDGNAFHACGGIAGHAGLFATVPDLLRYGSQLLGEHGPLRHRTVAQFSTDGPDIGQALGFRTWLDDADGCTARVFGHPGFPGVVLGMMPRHQAVVVLAVNRLHVDGGEPMPTEPAWRAALHAAHQTLHEEGA